MKRRDIITLLGGAADRGVRTDQTVPNVLQAATNLGIGPLDIKVRNSPRYRRLSLSESSDGPVIMVALMTIWREWLMTAEVLRVIATLPLIGHDRPP